MGTGEYTNPGTIPGSISHLMRKHERPIEDHLEEALMSQAVGDRYAHPEPRREDETLEAYAERLAKQAATYQFVRVIFNRETHFIAFGVPGPLVTPFGRFTLVPALVVGGRWGTHYFLFYPDVEATLASRNNFVRLDSGCMSGQLFGDLTCDCKEQLHIAMDLCAKSGSGIIMNMPAHDGRGWGEYKMANQQLMDECGLDTVTAAKLFYGSLGNIDQRTYTESVIILRAFGFNEEHVFHIGTNNPRKIGAFTSFGMNLETVEPILAKEDNPVVKRNLAAKAQHMGHKIPASEAG